MDSHPTARYAPGESIPELLCPDEPGHACNPPLRPPFVLPASFCPACGSDELVTPTRSLVTRLRCGQCNYLIASWKPGMTEWASVALHTTPADEMQSVLARMRVESERSHTESTGAHSAGDKLLCEALLVAAHGTPHQQVAEAIVDRYEALLKFYG